LDNVIKGLLACKNTSDYSKIKGLDSERSDIIVAGALILEQLFSELKIEEMTYSDYALREGVLLDSIHKVLGEKRLAGLSDIRYKSFRYLMKLYNIEESHALQVSKLALRLFDSTVELHKLDFVDREYLEAACLVHDVGYYISSSQHHRHSYYVVRNAEILGFSDREIEIIANIARYHRKSHPKLKHENFVKLNKKDQLKVKKMASLIRIADGLDRSHISAVLNIDTVISGEYIIFQIEQKAGVDVTLDVWGAERKCALFEEVYGYKVKFDIK
jgi:exopolyphosphatase/guanosine-5'-triphosphate,3'-diphosphate pyrophosphatase